MCIGGSSSNSSTAEYLSYMQMQQSAADDAASLAEQKREFDISSAERATDLASTQAQEAQSQAEADKTAALTEQYQTGRSAEAAQATKDINDAFAQFTPDYYKSYQQAYMNQYDPEVERQYGVAKQNLTYGLARQGIDLSQSAATQQGLLAQEKGRNEADIAGKAYDAANTLEANVASAKTNLLNTALSDQTLGSPITPGSSDAITAAFNTTSNALSTLKSSAGDTVSALAAVPSYNALGSLFGGAASGVANYVAGSQYAGYGLNTNTSPSASSPTGGSSSRVVG